VRWRTFVLILVGILLVVAAEAVSTQLYVLTRPPGVVKLHRFYNLKLGTHFYTTDEAERDKLLSQYAHVWAYEGAACYVWPIDVNDVTP